MKTAISVPDRVFQKAERLARRLKKSRSQLYSEALLEYVSRHDPAVITAALDGLFESTDSRADRFVRESSEKVLQSSEW